MIGDAFQQSPLGAFVESRLGARNRVSVAAVKGLRIWLFYGSRDYVPGATQQRNFVGAYRNLDGTQTPEQRALWDADVEVYYRNHAPGGIFENLVSILFCAHGSMPVSAFHYIPDLAPFVGTPSQIVGGPMPAGLVLHELPTVEGTPWIALPNYQQTGLHQYLVQGGAYTEAVNPILDEMFGRGLTFSTQVFEFIYLYYGPYGARNIVVFDDNDGPIDRLRARYPSIAGQSDFVNEALDRWLQSV